MLNCISVISTSEVHVDIVLLLLVLGTSN